VGNARDGASGGGCAVAVKPEVMERALDKALQPPQILWGVYADSPKQGRAFLVANYAKHGVKITPGDIAVLRTKALKRRIHSWTSGISPEFFT